MQRECLTIIALPQIVNIWCYIMVAAGTWLPPIASCQQRAVGAVADVYVVTIRVHINFSVVPLPRSLKWPQI